MAKAGRPVKFESPDEMQEAIDKYFADCKEENETITVSGLAYALDMTTETLRTYGEKDGFSATVKKAKQKVEIFIEKQLMSGRNATGPIFNLKNNFDWKDKVEREVNAKVELNDVSDEEIDRRLKALLNAATETDKTAED